MSDDRENTERVSELAEALADGRRVDWPSAETSASSPHDRQVISGLKDLSQFLDLRRQWTPPAPRVRADVAPRSEVPRHWGPLRILEKVGEGAFGEVYRAHDPKLARDVALKLLREPASDEEADATAAIEEGRLLARVRHPNVVTVYGADRIDGRVGVWMELIDGRTLDQVVREHGPFDADEAARIGIDLARALAAVHDAGLVHRDIKAQNVMREDSRRLVLMDFGTGRERGHSTDTSVVDLTGTPLYVAPEVLRGERATSRSDIYSLGVLLYFLATGEYHVRANTLRDLVAAHRTNARRTLHEANPSLPAAFVEVVERAISADPASRYPTARALESALGGSTTSRSTGVITPRRVAIALAATVLIATGVAAWPRLSTPRAVEQPQATPPPVTASASPPASAAMSDAASGAPAAPSPAGAAAGSAPLPAALVAAVPSAPATSWVLVGAIDNQTGDDGLDGWFDLALARELSDAPYVKVAFQSRIDDALAALGKPAGARLDPETARAVCRRDGQLPVLITGTAHATGQTISIAVKVINATSGSVLASLTERAASRDAVPEAIRREALKVREALGEKIESRPDGHERARAIATPSMASVRLLADGLKVRPGDFPNPAPPLRAKEEAYRRALAADDSNTAAMFALGSVLNNEAALRDADANGLNRAALKAEAATWRERATARTDMATPLERDLIDLWVHGDRADSLVGDARRVEGQLAAAAIEDALAIEPSDPFDLLFRLNSLYSATLGKQFNRPAIIARSADIRPLNLEANTHAAMIKFAAGDVPGAGRYAQIAHEIATTTRQASRPWLVLFPMYKAWLANDAGRVLSEIDHVWADTVDVGVPTRANFARDVTDSLLSMGLVNRAASVAAQTPDGQRGNRLSLIARVRAAAGDQEALRALLDANPNAVPLHEDYCIDAGLIDECHQLLDTGRMQARPEKLLRAQLALHDGDAARAVENGNAVRELFAVKPIADPKFEMRTAEIIGQALNDLGRPAEAIDLLSGYAANRQMAYPEGGVENYVWLRLRLILAESYQKAGQREAARKIEDELSKQLRLADDTFPLLVKLKQLMGK